MRLLGVTLAVVGCLGAAHGQALFSKLSFGPVVTATADSRACAVGDVDGDGDLDVLVVNASAPNALYLNDGSGAFTPTASVVTGDVGNSSDALFADLDGDGDLDLLVSRRFGGTLRYYLNLGGAQGGTEGTWLPQESDPITSAGGDATSLTAGDVDGDGDQDVVITNGNGLANALYVNQGGAQGGAPGSFAAATVGDFVTHQANTMDCAVGDVDGDGDLDIAVANAGGQDNVVYLNDGAGVFDVGAIDVSTGGDTQAVAMEDLDVDGDLDVVFVNFLGTNDVYRNRGGAQGGVEGTLDLVVGHPLSLGTGQLSFGITFGDWNEDGRPDALIANCCGQDNALYENSGGFTYTQVMAGIAAFDGGYSFDACFFDFDGDGDEELLVVNSAFAGDNRNSLYRNDFFLGGGAGFTNLGQGLAGAFGTPVLKATGTLVPSSPLSFVLDEAPPLTIGSLIIGLSAANLPFKGGTLVPAAHYGMSFPTDAAGAYRLDGIWPQGVPSGFETYYQVWLVDLTGPQGFSATNALEGKSF